MISFALLCSGSRLVEILLVSDYVEVTTGYKPESALQKYRGYVAATPVAKEGAELRRINKRFLELKALAPEKNKNLTFEDVQEQVAEEGGLSQKVRYFPSLFLDVGEFTTFIHTLRAKMHRLHPWTKKMDRNKPEDVKKIAAKFGPGVNKVLNSLKWRQGGGKKITSRIMRKLYARYSFIVERPDVPFLFWVKSVLGHNNSNTSRNYINTVVQTVVKLEQDPSLITQMGKLVREMEALQHKWKSINKNGTIVSDRGMATVDLVDGGTTLWEKQPSLRDGPEGKMKRLKSVIAAFKKKNVKVNRKNVNAVGFGAAVFRKYQTL
jgi:hypothetical protein